VREDPANDLNIVGNRQLRRGNHVGQYHTIYVTRQ
jgi:hypothetical protein